jgi:hypothetical protein
MLPRNCDEEQRAYSGERQTSCVSIADPGITGQDTSFVKKLEALV